MNGYRPFFTCSDQTQGCGEEPICKTEPLEDKVLRKIPPRKGRGAYLLVRLTDRSVNPLNPKTLFISSDSGAR